MHRRLHEVQSKERMRRTAEWKAERKAEAIARKEERERVAMIEKG